MQVTASQVVAFRVAQQGLAERAPAPDAILGGWAIQDSPPGSAALALHARVDGLDPGWLDAALHDDRAAVAIYNPRTATAVLPAGEVASYTRGLLPPDEGALRHVLGRAVPDEGTPPRDAVRRTLDVLDDALDGRTLSRDELHAALRERLPADLLPWCEGCGSHHPRRGLLVAASLHGRLCLAGRVGRQPAFARTDHWLEARAPRARGGDAHDAAPDDAAAAEVVRCFLRAYGPATPQRFAQWAGISPAHAARSWALVEQELTEVKIDAPDSASCTAFLLDDDRARLADPAPAHGVRLLPPGDPLLLARDRELLIADEPTRKQLWRAINAPGLVLVDGRPTALWHGRKQGRRLAVALQPLTPLPQRTLRAIEHEAQRAAAHPGCSSATVETAA